MKRLWNRESPFGRAISQLRERGRFCFPPGMEPSVPVNGSFRPIMPFWKGLLARRQASEVSF